GVTGAVAVIATGFTLADTSGAEGDLTREITLHDRVPTTAAVQADEGPTLIPNQIVNAESVSSYDSPLDVETAPGTVAPDASGSWDSPASLSPHTVSVQSVTVSADSWDTPHDGATQQAVADDSYD